MTTYLYWIQLGNSKQLFCQMTGKFFNILIGRYVETNFLKYFYLTNIWGGKNLCWQIWVRLGRLKHLFCDLGDSKIQDSSISLKIDFSWKWCLLTYLISQVQTIWVRIFWRDQKSPDSTKFHQRSTGTTNRSIGN